MKTNNRDGDSHSTGVGALLFVWIISVVLSMIAGHCGGYLAGVRPGGWNMHMIYPPIIGGAIGLIAYPILRISIQAASEGKDQDKGLFSAMFATVIVAGATCFFLW